jgi:hypothetical protein
MAFRRRAGALQLARQLSHHPHEGDAELRLGLTFCCNVRLCVERESLDFGDDRDWETRVPTVGLQESESVLVLACVDSGVRDHA